jgi:hypothetical protein
MIEREREREREREQRVRETNRETKRYIDRQTQRETDIEKERYRHRVEKRVQNCKERSHKHQPTAGTHIHAKQSETACKEERGGTRVCPVVPTHNNAYLCPTNCWIECCLDLAPALS